MVVLFFKVPHNGHVYGVVADFGERSRPAGLNYETRIRQTTPHEPRNAIYNLLPAGF